ncbi:MAG: hypothetical protein FJX99_02105 [Bacteroidetes bacterium]|nr:hypothetical protein [Bacteroidota bacterium]
MKRVFFSVTALLLLSYTMISCNKNKCHECHYDKAGVEIELGEKCGDELENLEANGYTDSTGNYVVHCHEH